MIWARVDDKLHAHPKALRAGLSMAIWLMCLSHCGDFLTDGFVAREVVIRIAGSAKAAKRHAAKLVEVGLWTEADGGWKFHDYQQYQPLRAAVESERARKAEAGRLGGFAKAAKHPLSTRQPPATPPPAPSQPAASGSALLPIPIPIPIQEREGERAPARETLPPAQETETAEHRRPRDPEVEVNALSGFLDGYYEATDAKLSLDGTGRIRVFAGLREHGPSERDAFLAWCRQSGAEFGKSDPKSTAFFAITEWLNTRALEQAKARTSAKRQQERQQREAPKTTEPTLSVEENARQAAQMSADLEKLFGRGGLT